MNLKKLALALAAVIVLLSAWLAWLLLPHDDTIPLMPKDAPVFARDHIHIRRADGQVVGLEVELATTPREAAFGLMFRRKVDPQTGMLFIWDTGDHPVSMWMKNTYVALDMLFIRHDGVITKIITHARPHDLTPLSSDDPVHAVLEIKAGEANHLGLKVGDNVDFWAFGKGF